MFTPEMFANLFSTHAIIGLLIGTVGGFLIGVLPGMTATMGIALLIPFTFGMEPAAGLIMLCAIYGSAVYGGAIPAILLHTPGTPASAATAKDGYELTLKGDGYRTIGVATVSTVFGGVLGVLVVIFLTPPLARLGLRFNAPEFFLIAILGLSIIGSLAGDNPIKGLMAGVLGLAIALIGFDTVFGVARFTYQIPALEGGIQMVPALIGLFSISQVLVLAEDFGSDKKTKVVGELRGKFLPPLPEFIANIPNLIRSTFVGIVVGIIPGAGADIGAWLSYNEAKRFSKNRQNFGKGAIEAVYAAESANNATAAGSLIPLLALGIPGGAAVAVLMGGMTIQGLTPGHNLFVEHAAITYAILFGFLISKILAGVVGFLIAKPAVRLARVPSLYLVPIIVVFSAVGTFALNMSMFDITVMAVFGILGYLMRKTGFPTAPVVLAIILGPMAEGGFQRSLLMARGENLFTFFMGRPFSVPIILLIVLSLFSPLITKAVQKRSSVKKQAVTEKAEESQDE